MGIDVDRLRSEMGDRAASRKSRIAPVLPDDADGEVVEQRPDVKGEGGIIIGMNLFIPRSWIRPDGGLDIKNMVADLEHFFYMPARIFAKLYYRWTIRNTGPIAREYSKRFTVFLVDDYDKDLISYSKSLRERGYEVLAFHSPRSALRYLEKTGVLPSIMLSDLQLNGRGSLRTGFELAQTVRAKIAGEMPVVIHTGGLLRRPNIPIQGDEIVLLPKFEDKGLAAVDAAHEKWVKLSGPAANPVLRDISEKSELSQNLAELLASISLNKKTVLAFDDEIARSQGRGALSVFEELEKIKKESGLLRNLEIVKAPAGKLPGKLTPYIEEGSQIFTFALLKNKTEISKLPKNIALTYIDETRFPDSAYYPLAQIVAITLARHMRSGGINDLVSNRESLAKFNVKSIRPDPEDRSILIFKLLPKARRLETSELMKQYAAIKEFLRAA